MKNKYNAPDVSIINFDGREVLTSSGEWTPGENETERSSTTKGRTPLF